MLIANRPPTCPAWPYVATASENEFLQEMRSVGDAPADLAIERWVEDAAARDPQAVARVLARGLAEELVGFEVAPRLPEVLKFLEKPADPDLTFDDQEEALAEYLFADHGLKILLILAFYSLPAAYAAFRGVPVLNSRRGSTGGLVNDVNRRLIETTQFVLEVLTSINPTPTPRCRQPQPDKAVGSARRVRLLHALVRNLILNHPDPRWNRQDLGTPVNQEDMAGTFLTFSWVVIDGLRKLHVRMSPEQEKVFYEIWKRFEPSLGLLPRLVPETLDDAERLTTLIRARQVDGPISEGKVNADGKLMARALLDFLRSSLPWPLKYIRRLPASVMRFFLPTSPTDVASSIGIPRTYGLDELVRLWFFIEAYITRYRIFDVMNRLVFKEWGRQNERARSLFQFSRFFTRRYVLYLAERDRNEHLDVKHRTQKIDLLGWDERWHFDQASFVTRGVRTAASKLRR